MLRSLNGSLEIRIYIVPFRPAHSSRIPIYGPISGAIALRPPLQQFVDWSKEQICEWMAEIGFSVYVPEVERFIRSGRHLLNMTNQEYEKVLISNSKYKVIRIYMTLLSFSIRENFICLVKRKQTKYLNVHYDKIFRNYL